MDINTELLVPMTDANQNFSKVVRIVDEEGLAVILKNNKPRYVIAPFSEYDEMIAWKKERSGRIEKTAVKVLEDNLEAFRELAK